MQTPQGFRISTLTARIAGSGDGVSVTDDASACEHAGYQVTLVQGDREAMKVTEPLDLVIAEALAAKEK